MDTILFKRNKEERSFKFSELRADRNDDKTTVRGYAAVFDQLSEDLGGFREKIEPGAFTKTLKEADIRALWNHDTNIVLGRTTSGTLRLGTDKTGLSIEIDPPKSAAQYIESIERGDVDQMSFGFKVIKDEWDEVDGETIRTLKEIRLFEVSPVTFPAYPQTEVKVRSLEIDFLSRTLLKVEKGLTINENDVKMLTEARAVIDNLLKNSKQKSDNSLDLYKRKLALLNLK